MNFFNKIHITLLGIIISNVYTDCKTEEMSQITKNQTSITIDHLNNLFWEYPAFIKLTLQKQEYYTGKDISRCPMRYNKNTIIDDPDIVAINLFNPRELKKPWTWTRKNEIDVPVPIKGTIGLKLGEIIQPCLKNNTNIIQCYTHYLNVIESVGLTLIDRFCLFTLEVQNRLKNLKDTTDYTKDYSLFDIRINFSVLSTVYNNYQKLFDNISFAFKRYYISTLPLDCVENTMEKLNLYFNQAQNKDDEIKQQFLNCRELMKSKINYAILESDQYWKWDTTSDYKPDNNLLILSQYENNEIGLKLFFFNEKK